MTVETQFRVPVTSESGGTIHLEDPTALPEEYSWSRLTLSAPVVDPQEKLLVAGTSVGILLWFLFVLRELHGLLLTIADGTPFLARNVARIRRLGWATLVAWLFAPASALLINGLIEPRFLTPGLYGGEIRSLEFDFSKLILALTIFVIAEVFRQGVALWEEQRMTI